MRPAPRLFWLLGGWLAWAVLASFWPTLITPWAVGGVVLLLFAALDGWWAWRQAPPRIVRKLAHSLPVGVWREVLLEIENPLPQKSVIRVFDHYPSACDMEGLPLTFTLAPQTRTRAPYRLRFTARGEHSFVGIEALIDSPFSLLHRRVFIDATHCARVYPNFAAVAKYALLATDNHLSRIGVRQRRRRGEGQSFHQLREYREGDTPRQIDWKATARVNKLVSREYQDERDQQIMFLLDCGNRMRAKEDGSLSHFDEALNALLLLAHVALRQGDAVGCMSFGHDTRLVPARKGRAALNHLMERLFDLEPGSNSPDYRSAATHIAKTVHKRSLVLILTNLRDEDDEELRDAIEVLRRRHLVLLASLRETAVQHLIEQPRTTLEAALEAAAALQYISIRNTTIERLKRSGAHVLDVTPAMLPIALVNRYLDFKSSGAL
ncbi:MAG: DUF58 domain-containing protein [Azoarcus sp.]|jgi:uncharacterized protein (DUF58 family)|nr:DUF58 domain-containing protein [Azoarcus sp.]